MRALVLVLALLAGPVWATPPNVITKAEFSEPTGRYDHGILGDAVEWGALVLTVDLCLGCEIKQVRKFTIRLPESRVFEDLTPRLVPLDDEAGPAAMVVETDLERGARLALYYESGLIAATPFIGRTHRWLAPIGAADLDGDGQYEYAYVDRPHLANTIRVWRRDYDSAALQLVAELPGYTNHRIGQDYISGGIRECGDGPEMIVAEAGWQNIAAVTLGDQKLSARILAPFTGRRSMQQAMDCKF